MNNSEIVNKINNLNKEYQFEIFQIIKKTNINYTENNNGIFIDFKDITCLDELLQYINFIDNNKKDLIKFEELKDINRKKLLDKEELSVNDNGIEGDKEIDRGYGIEAGKEIDGGKGIEGIEECYEECYEEGYEEGCE